MVDQAWIISLLFLPEREKYIFKRSYRQLDLFSETLYVSQLYNKSNELIHLSGYNLLLVAKWYQ